MTGESPSRHGALWIGALLVVVGAPRTARAIEAEITGDVAAQGYEVVSPWGDVVLGKRRLTTALGFSAHALQGEYKPFEPDYSVHMRVRLDADFGIEEAERNFDPANPSRFVPGVDRTPVDIMYLYVEGRNLAGGWLGFKAGRQYLTDVLGWWSFDGGLVRLVTPWWVQVEAYGGFEQRGGLPLSTTRFEQQGIWRGSHGDIEGRDTAYPSYQFAGIAPAFGFAAESNGPNWVHGRFSYRRVYSTAEAFTSQFPSPGGGGYEKVDGLRISSERLGYALSAFYPGVGGVRGGFMYDLYNQLVGRAYGGVDVHIGPRVTTSADYEFFWPTFDADSIFNWFTHLPSHTAQARVAVRPIDGLELSGGGGVRLWLTEGDPESWAQQLCAQISGGDPAALQNCLLFGLEPTLPGADRDFARNEDNRDLALAPDLLANWGASYRWGTGSANLRGMIETGFGGPATDRGRRVGGDVAAKQSFAGQILWLGGRVGVWNWHDTIRPDRDATSFGYVVAPEVWPHDIAKFRVEWEHNMNRLVGQRFRILGLVTLKVIP
jgi:hypothetical protein